MLLREWNFERFFPENMRHSSSDSSSNKSSHPKSESLAYLEKKKIEELNNKLKLENRVKSAIYAKNNNNSFGDVIPLASTKKPENDSRFSNFVRGFRRENSDFFPQTKRHSAIFGEQSVTTNNITPQLQQRSSAIFQRNRTKGEPILTDYNSNRDATLINRAKLTASLRTRNSSVQQQAQPQQKPGTTSVVGSGVTAGMATPPAASKNLDFLRMRREKTESVIFVSRNSEARQQLLLNQQVILLWDAGKTFFIYCFFFFTFLLSYLFSSYFFFANKFHKMLKSYDF